MAQTTRRIMLNCIREISQRTRLYLQSIERMTAAIYKSLSCLAHICEGRRRSAGGWLRSNLSHRANGSLKWIQTIAECDFFRNALQVFAGCIKDFTLAVQQTNAWLALDWKLKLRANNLTFIERAWQVELLCQVGINLCDCFCDQQRKTYDNYRQRLSSETLLSLKDKQKTLAWFPSRARDKSESCRRRGQSKAAQLLVTRHKARHKVLESG